MKLGERLQQQMMFLNEVERLKTVLRRNRIIDRSRFENSAEHSWHLALMAMVLNEHAAAAQLDHLRVIKMLLIHDLVEIYAGDTWAFDEVARQGQTARERMAARQLFALLPEDQTTEFLALWEEFEARETAEAMFAAALDALQPLANHLLTSEPSVAEHGLSKGAVLARKQGIAAASPALWDLTLTLIEESVQKGLYREE